MKRILINIGLRCCAVGVGLYGAVMIFPAIFVLENTLSAKAFKFVSLVGSLLMISGGMVALCRKSNYLLMSGFVITGIISHVLAYSWLRYAYLSK